MCKLGRQWKLSVHLFCKKHTHTSTRYRQKTANRPSAHPLPASPTAALNVRKLCSGECCGKRSAYGNTPADTPLCSAEREEMKPNRQKSDVSRLAYQHRCRSDFKYTSHTPNAVARYKGTRPHRGCFFFPTRGLFVVQANDDYT